MASVPAARDAGSNWIPDSYSEIAQSVPPVPPVAEIDG